MEDRLDRIAQRPALLSLGHKQLHHRTVVQLGFVPEIKKHGSHHHDH